MGTLNPLDQSHIAEGERCLSSLGFKGLLICSSWHGRFIDGEDSFAFWEWAQDRQVPVFIHPPRVPIGHEQQMDQFKLDELIGRPFDTAMALARMILSGLFDRYPRLKIVVAHMGGGLLPCMGRLDFGYRLGCEGMPEHSVIRCKKMPSDYLKLLHVDTMGFWAPHVREAVEVFGADRVMFGTDYGPVPIDPKEHIDIVNALAISAADKEKILWRNAAKFFDLDVAAMVAERLISTVTFASLMTAAHFCHLARQHGRHLRRRLERDRQALARQARLHDLLRQRDRHRLVEPVDHRRRRLGRRKQRRPGVGLDARRRRPRRRSAPRQAAASACALATPSARMLPDCDLLRDQPGQRRDAEIDAAGEQFGRHRRQPLERHMQHVDAGLGLEQFGRRDARPSRCRSSRR